jgi:hypothetical protein
MCTPLKTHAGCLGSSTTVAGHGGHRCTRTCCCKVLSIAPSVPCCGCLLQEMTRSIEVGTLTEASPSILPQLQGFADSMQEQMQDLARTVQELKLVSAPLRKERCTCAHADMRASSPRPLSICTNGFTTTYQCSVSRSGFRKLHTRKPQSYISVHSGTPRSSSTQVGGSPASLQERERMRSSLAGLSPVHAAPQTAQLEEQVEQQPVVQQQGGYADWLSRAAAQAGLPGRPSRATLQLLHSAGVPQQLPADVLAALQRAAVSFTSAGSPRRGVQGPDLGMESRDPCTASDVLLQVMAYLPPASAGPAGSTAAAASGIPESMFLSFQFYSFPATRTAAARLVPAQAQVQQQQEQLMLLQAPSSSGSSSSVVARYLVDGSQLAHSPEPGAAEQAAFHQHLQLCRYLASRTVDLELWDARSLLHLGTAQLELQVRPAVGAAVVVQWCRGAPSCCPCPCSCRRGCRVLTLVIHTHWSTSACTCHMPHRATINPPHNLSGALPESPICPAWPINPSTGSLPAEPAEAGAGGHGDHAAAAHHAPHHSYQHI